MAVPEQKVRYYAETIAYLEGLGYTDDDAKALVDQINDRNFTDIAQDSRVHIRRVGIHPWTYKVSVKRNPRETEREKLIWSMEGTLRSLQNMSEEQFASFTTGNKSTIYRITVNWVQDAHPEGIEADLAEFRTRHPAVTFTEDESWVPGPGSDQFPLVRIESAGLVAIQAAIREFAGVNLATAAEVRESWEYDTRTGLISQASFNYRQPDGRGFGTDVLDNS